MIKSWLQNIGLSGPKMDLSGVWVDRPTYAVGDIHGRADLLDRMIGLIGQDAAARGNPVPRIIFMGDYIDRGNHSRAVLERLADLPAETGWEIHCLRGNHEVMLAEFLADPEAAAPRWLRNGGLETLLSYQVGGIGSGVGLGGLIDARDHLLEQLGPVRDWLETLLSRYHAGSVFFAHAGADPSEPIQSQSEHCLYWGTPGFLQRPRQDGIWVVHGHYIVDEAHIAPSRIAVDTGACYSGHLTAARIEDEAVTFLTATAQGAS